MGINVETLHRVDEAIPRSSELFSPPEHQELLDKLLPSLLCIDHGFDPAKAGYTAAGFLSAGHIVTASHNLNHGFATVIYPKSLRRDTYQFFEFEPDSAVSAGQVEPEPIILPIGSPKVDDLHLAYWLRHLGGGVFLPCVMWGTNIGCVQQSKKLFWGFNRNGIQPRAGDSGAMILTLGETNDDTKIVGVFRGVKGDNDEICVFSPLENQ